MSMRHALLVAFAAATALLAGCGGDDTTGKADTDAPPAAASSTIEIADFVFDPDPVTVKAGATITVKNTDKAPHTVTQEGAKPSFDSGTVLGGKSGSVAFSKAGTYRYFCQFHPTMKGTVVVVK